MERFGFGHSFGTVKKQGREVEVRTALLDKVACTPGLLSNEFDGSSKEVASCTAWCVHKKWISARRIRPEALGALAPQSLCARLGP